MRTQAINDSSDDESLPELVEHNDNDDSSRDSFTGMVERKVDSISSDW